jgi:exopolyphosphatase/guanosine-5'-triphosphate,3'-diphosphate pyrophosphatase
MGSRRAGDDGQAVADRPVAVIDIGSNSLRLVIYDRFGRAPLALLNEKSLCGLGRDLDSTGLLNPAAVACALHAIRRFVRMAAGMGVQWIDIIATEAVRRAENGAEFCAEAERAAGQPITVLSGEEEARFSALGVALSHLDATGIVADMGGGSLELARLVGGTVADELVSLRLGSLPIAGAYAKGTRQATALIDEALASAPWLDGAAAGGALYLVGGSWRALGRIRLARGSTPLRVIHGYSLSPDEAAELTQSLQDMKADKLKALPGMPGRRADTVQGAALLLERIIKRLRPARIVFSVLGLREGRLFQRLPAETRASDPLLEGAADLARASGRAPGIGPVMTQWTDGLFPAEPAQFRRLRQAVAELSDTGWREHPMSRAREEFFLIAQYPFIGVTHGELVFLAYALFIRYGGKRDDAAIQPMLDLLPEGWRRQAEILGDALSLAYRLSGGVPDLLDGTRLELHGRELRLHLGLDDVAPDLDALQPRLDRLATALEASRARIVVGGMG